MAPAITCPRCAEPMERFTRPAEGGATLLADMCDRCGGLWLDGGEVAAVYPAFAELPERLAELSIPGRAHSGLPACPRCASKPIEFPFFDLHLDSCPSCHGLWVDGDELIELARSRDRRDGLPAPETRSAGYRSNAAAVLRAGMMICKGCGAELHVRATTMTADGARCAACAEVFEREQAHRGGDEGKPAIPMRSLFSLGEGDGATGSEIMSFLGVFLGGVLDIGGRCSRCGCSRYSRCRH